jgi:hypothetical protein
VLPTCHPLDCSSPAIALAAALAAAVLVGSRSNGHGPSYDCQWLITCCCCCVLPPPSPHTHTHPCRYLALDEADRMVDLGFEEEVRGGGSCGEQVFLGLQVLLGYTGT